MSSELHRNKKSTSNVSRHAESSMWTSTLMPLIFWMVTVICPVGARPAIKGNCASKINDGGMESQESGQPERSDLLASTVMLGWHRNLAVGNLQRLSSCKSNSQWLSAPRSKTWPIAFIAQDKEHQRVFQMHFFRPTKTTPAQTCPKPLFFQILTSKLLQRKRCQTRKDKCL